MIESIRLDKDTNILVIISSIAILMRYVYDIVLIGSQFTCRRE